MSDQKQVIVLTDPRKVNKDAIVLALTPLKGQGVNMLTPLQKDELLKVLLQLHDLIGSDGKIK
jgi:hypothetical protein